MTTDTDRILGIQPSKTPASNVQHPGVRDESQTREEQKAIDELSETVASDLAEGKSQEHVVSELVKQDWSEEWATQFVSQVERSMSKVRVRNAKASQYARHMIYGTLWVIGGTVVTAATYQAASEGGTYLIAWGAILFGGIDFLRGLFGWLKYSS